MEWTGWDHYLRVSKMDYEVSKKMFEHVYVGVWFYSIAYLLVRLFLLRCKGIRCVYEMVH